jgi:hypothetical protein
MEDTMTREDLLDDDVIGRVANLRPDLDEDDLAPGGARATAIVERIVRAHGAPGPITPQVASPRRAGRLSRGGLVAILGVAAATAAAALVIAGTFSGPDGSGAQPARADVFKLTADAMSGGPGTVVVEKFENTQGHAHPMRSSQTIITLTPSGSGPEEILNAGDPVGKVLGTAVLGADQEVYTPSTNTIYVSSIWGPYIHRGTKPGTYVYRPGPGAVTNGLRSFPLTAAQAAGLRNGTHQLEINADQKWHYGPVLRALSDTQSTVQLLREHAYHYDGKTTLRGRTVLKFGGPKWNPRAVGTARDPHDIGGIDLYVDPQTHLPVEETLDRGSQRSIQVWTQYKVLPVDPATARLVTLQSLYPNARVDRNHADYVKAAHGVGVFTGC